MSTNNFTKEIPKETELLLASIGSRITDNPADVVELASQEIDWDKFLADVEAKRLGALVYHNWQVAGILSKLPESAIDKLKTTYYQMLYRNLAAETFISQVLKKITKEADCIVLKGLALLNTVYDSIALRTFCDVDLLIKKEDSRDVEEIIGRLGGKVAMQSDCETTYRFELPESSGLGGDLVFDVSWEITSSRRFAAATKWDVKGVWKRSIPVSIGEVELKTLSPEDTLVHLCYHVAFRHLFQTTEIRWYVDLHQLISRCQLDWKAIVAQANEYGIGTVVGISLSLATKLLETKVPSWIFKELKSKRPAKWVAKPLIHHPMNVTADVRGDFWYLATQSLFLDRPSQLVKVGMKSVKPGLRWFKRRHQKKTQAVLTGKDGNKQYML